MFEGVFHWRVEIYWGWGGGGVGLTVCDRGVDGDFDCNHCVMSYFVMVYEN